MTQKKMLVSVFLVLLVAFGWMQLLTSGGSRAQYNSLMESAQGLMERGLYQKAGQEYFLAAQEINTEEACSAAVEAFRAGYVQDEELFDDYQQALEQAELPLTVRAEAVPFDGWIKLANALKEQLP